MSPTSLEDIPLNDQEYLIYRAKETLNTDPNEAKAWMITAKTLFPNDFGIQVNIKMIN